MSDTEHSALPTEEQIQNSSTPYFLPIDITRATPEEVTAALKAMGERARQINPGCPRDLNPIHISYRRQRQGSSVIVRR